MKKLLGILLTALLAVPAHAAVVYNESSGDLGNGPRTSTALGTLSVGLNTIAGSISQSGCSEFSCSQRDFDYFSMVLLSGTEIDSISIFDFKFVGYRGAN